MKYVYLIRRGDTDTYKIGVAADVKKRLKQLQTAQDEVLWEVNQFKTDFPYLVEKAVHRHFRKKLGEWFELDCAAVSQFSSICQLADHNFRLLNEENSYFKNKYGNKKP